MPKHAVTIFKPYPLEIGQKIRIDSGPRSGDWEVIGITENKIILKCPVSQRTFSWARFCYFTEQRENETWPLEH